MTDHFQELYNVFKVSIITTGIMEIIVFAVIFTHQDANPIVDAIVPMFTVLAIFGPMLAYTGKLLGEVIMKK